MQHKPYKNGSKNILEKGQKDYESVSLVHSRNIASISSQHCCSPAQLQPEIPPINISEGQGQAHKALIQLIQLTQFSHQAKNYSHRKAIRGGREISSECPSPSDQNYTHINTCIANWTLSPFLTIRQRDESEHEKGVIVL